MTIANLRRLATEAIPNQPPYYLAQKPYLDFLILLDHFEAELKKEVQVDLDLESTDDDWCSHVFPPARPVLARSPGDTSQF